MANSVRAGALKKLQRNFDTTVVRLRRLQTKPNDPAEDADQGRFPAFKDVIKPARSQDIAGELSGLGTYDDNRGWSKPLKGKDMWREKLDHNNMATYAPISDAAKDIVVMGTYEDWMLNNHERGVRLDEDSVNLILRGRQSTEDGAPTTTIVGTMNDGTLWGHSIAVWELPPKGDIPSPRILHSV